MCRNFAKIYKLIVETLVYKSSSTNFSRYLGLKFFTLHLETKTIEIQFAKVWDDRVFDFEIACICI